MYTKEEKKNMRIDFWEAYKEYSKQHGRKMMSWILTKTAIAECQLKFDMRDNSAFVMIQVDHKTDERRFEVYNKFKKYKPIIDETCGEDIVWDEHYFIEGFKEISTIYYKLNEVDIYSKDKWEKTFSFFFTKMCLLEDAYEDVIDAVKG